MKILMPALTAAALHVGVLGLCAQSSVPAAAPVSRVHQLEMEDQSENPGNISAAEYYRHGDARRAEVRKLAEEGKLRSGEDFSDAALIFQHGQTPEDFLYAHVLAVEALMHGSDGDRWLAAATLDRYLQAMDRPQVFGTQYAAVKSAANTPKQQVNPRVVHIDRTQQPFDAHLLPDSVRQDFCVPDLDQQEKNLAVFNTGHRPEGKMMRAATCNQ